MVSCLLIDQNRFERGRISCLLDELGVQPHQLSDIQGAIQFCRDNTPDVVMLEASALPEAKEFLRLVRQQGRSTGRPVVILYATDTSMAAMGDGILNGASEFMMLPFDLDLLRFKLSQSGVLLAAAA
jgi:two-component system, chemotaxis family, chemotaxis protein CheY